MKWAAVLRRWKIIGMFGALFYRPLRGLELFFNRVHRVALAKPRSTLGFTLTPASQANGLCLRLLCRLTILITKMPAIDKT